MKLTIKDILTFRDGGTIEVRCEGGMSYFIDGRRYDSPNPTYKMLFKEYPNSSIPIPKNEAREIKKTLLLSLKEFGVQSQKYQHWLPIFKEIKI